MEAIQFIQITPEQLETQILQGVKSQLEDLKKHFQPKEPNEYMTRKEVALMFRVDINTINNWAKSKRLNPLAMGGRILFLRSEVEASLTPLNV